MTSVIVEEVSPKGIIWKGDRQKKKTIRVTCCWRCKAYKGVTLMRVNKTSNYICNNCVSRNVDPFAPQEGMSVKEIEV